ncbi:unnamed protein product [Wuchereria bancrofti]|uniref:Uncharacterized protein n=1 Tax=Wuchereria bancrofti TaxID=6293 RepID=A0A3P7ERD2_WUCBA|nr:unnamed protein product [Wuchereria bancrofti]
MSASIAISANPTKVKLTKALNEIKQWKVIHPDVGLPVENRYEQCKEQERKLKEKQQRIEKQITTLERINEKWLESLQKVPATQREENQRYARMVEDDKGILKLIEDGWETLISLKLHIEDIQATMQCLQQSMERTSRNNSETDRISSQQEQGSTEVRRQLTVKLPRLALKNFDGNPKQWREFWSGFEAAVHQQNLADVQKLTYLLSCLRGTALNAVEGETTPENYETIRNILIERFGSPSIIKRALHHELQSFRHNDRDLRTTVETIERILRQLANLGENVEQTSIELAIEEKLPRWVLDEVYKKKELDPNWSVSKLRQCLETIVKRKETINQVYGQKNTNDGRKYDPSKCNRRIQLNQPRGTSALPAIQFQKGTTNRNINSSKRSRPCAFCNRDHWDDECRKYTTLEE